jgi:hypothetical protein
MSDRVDFDAVDAKHAAGLEEAKAAARVAAKEGWGVIRPGDRKAHYYVDAFSLCRRVGFYYGPLDVLDKPSPDDCAACRKKLDRNKGN